MKDEVTNLYLNIAPRLPRLIQDQPLERGGNAHPDPWPGAICAPGAIRIISGEGRVY
jgi:hypothetical protein